MVFPKRIFLKSVLCVALALFLVSSPVSYVDAALRQSCFNKLLCFITLEDGKSVKVSVKNGFDIPLRVSITVSGHNTSPLEASYNIPLLPGEIKTAFTLKAKPGKTWRYIWTSELHPGLEEVEHEQTIRYDLPFSSEASHPISQGPNSSFSHFGANQNAIDWAMPVGTEILAAREGLVIAFREDAPKGGSSPKYKTEQNYIWIQHDDGTIGHYLHLKKNGVLVEVGDKVSRGQKIGLSGNSGYSTAPHLHFHVSSSQLDGDAFKSFPITFNSR